MKFVETLLSKIQQQDYFSHEEHEETQRKIKKLCKLIH